MDVKEILDFIEDKEIIVYDDWYFHATINDISTIKNILEEGIKSASLLGQEGNHFNGQYYVSLYKNISEATDLKLWLRNSPKFIIHDISPFYADRKKWNFRRIFINTRVPLRTSEWDGEFQQYLRIDPSKIIGLEYSLAHILNNGNDFEVKEKLLFLKDIVLYLKQTNKTLPIYDLSQKCELNKEKILSLNI